MKKSNKNSIKKKYALLMERVQRFSDTCDPSDCAADDMVRSIQNLKKMARDIADVAKDFEAIFLEDNETSVSKAMNEKGGFGSFKFSVDGYTVEAKAPRRAHFDSEALRLWHVEQVARGIVSEDALSVKYSMSSKAMKDLSDEALKSLEDGPLTWKVSSPSIS